MLALALLGASAWRFVGGHELGYRSDRSSVNFKPS